jgi:cytochrome P450
VRGGLPAIDRQRRRVSLDAAHPAFFQDPYPAYEAIRAQCPVFFWEEYGHWCFLSFDDVDAALRDRRFGRDVLHVTTRSELGWPDIPPHLAPFYAVEANSMLEREPPVHTRLRGQVNRAFVSGRIAQLRPTIERLANRLIDAFPRDRPFDLLEAFCTPIPVAVICTLLGVPAAMEPQLLAWSHRMVAMYQYGRTRAHEDQAVLATEAFACFLREHLRDRRHHHGDDLIGQLLAKSQQDGGLSEDELVSTCILLLNAGHEATVHALGNAVAVLLRQPMAAERLADPAAAAAIVEELLRFDPPLHMFTRYALEDLHWQGLDLRRGDKVGLLLGAAGRDPRHFHDAGRFDPDRPDKRHLAFGAGIHFCLGAPLARLEMQLALPILFGRCAELSLAGPPRFRNSWHFHGLERLMVSCRLAGRDAGS